MGPMQILRFSVPVLQEKTMSTFFSDFFFSKINFKKIVEKSNDMVKMIDLLVRLTRMFCSYCQSFECTSRIYCRCRAPLYSNSQLSQLHLLCPEDLSGSQLSPETTKS